MSPLQLAEMLASCLCEEIRSSEEVSGVCFCGVVPGDAVAADYMSGCDDVCGMAYVRLTTVYPSVSVGVADTTPGNCGKSLGADFEVGILRCFDVDPEGEAPTEAEYLAATELQLADAMVIHRAITCCATSQAQDPFRKGQGVWDNEVVMGQYLPTGPEGGVVGGFWPISVAIP